MNRKVVQLIGILAGLLILSSCNMVGAVLGSLVKSDDQIAEDRMEQIVTILKDHDREALKSLFSVKALNEAVDIDSGIDYLFDLISGDIQTWKRGQLTSNKNTGREGEMRRVVSWHVVNTTLEQYKFILIDYYTDTIDPENVGLFTIFACIESEEDEHYRYWQDIMIAGVYAGKE
ncbi:MAG: DUF5104 domain-containing protein [Propionibacteriaceae bacterium]|nr:DUF5104 domain-containing protein [Propionibacteriaceae bacterium]